MGLGNRHQYGLDLLLRLPLLLKLRDLPLQRLGGPIVGFVGLGEISRLKLPLNRDRQPLTSSVHGFTKIYDFSGTQEEDGGLR